MAQQDIEGVYSFRRQEMVASFRFGKNGRFDFFYSYGAVDRVAQGEFYLEGSNIQLKSTKEPGKDFTILKQEKKGTGFTVKVNEPNAYLAKYVLGIYFSGDQQQAAVCNESQEIIIPDTACTKIYLQHQLFPDILTLIKDEQTDANYFEVTLNPSLQQVSFKGIDLVVEEDGLHCLSNYFMPVDNIVFRKEADQ
jgi:hypothetical protein